MLSTRPMTRAMKPKKLAVATGWMVALMATAMAEASTVWSGPPLTFAKSGIDNYQLPQFQDSVTATVHLTRRNTGGLFNVAQELAYTPGTSPLGTSWAFSGLNGNPTAAGLSAQICATTPASCTFTDWIDAAGGSGSGGAFIANRPAVMHLLADDIYVDVTFTEYTTASNGARITYLRSTPPVMAQNSRQVPSLPLAAHLALLTFLALTGARALRSK